MKLNYFEETDSLYIELSAKPRAESREISEGLTVDCDKDGNVVGLDIDHASKSIDLSTLEADKIPFLKLN